MQPFARLLLLTLAVVVVTGCGSGDDHRLTVAPVRIDFGRMLHGDVSEQTLTIANRGPGDVSITRTSFNCSCFTLHPFARLLHEGEERALKVRFHSGEVGTGPLRGKRLDLLTSDPEQPRLQVELVGEIVRSLTVLPGTVDLGTLGAPHSLETEVIRIRPGPGMEVDLVRFRGQPGDRLEVEAKEVDGGFDLSVRWKPPTEEGRGRFLGSVEIRTRVTGAEFDARELDHVVRIQGEWPRR